MKKVLLGFAAFTLSLSLAACSSNDSEKVSTEKETPQASTDVEKKTEQKESTKEKTADKSKEKDKKELVDVTLDRAVDGDTIKVTYNGNVDTVRYLLVDTPETKKPNSCVQPYGEDASKRNKELVNSGKLQLEFDKGDRRDKYGRLLAYVYVDGKSVQETLLKEGLARVAYVYEPNTKYIDQFKKNEQEAKSEKLSIWSKNGYVIDRGFNGCVKEKTTAVKKATTSKPAAKQPTTPKASSETSTTTENEASAESTGETETFKNCTELRKKYPNGVPSSHPAYQSKMDRDHDNYACER
ncbi:endonuclease YokF [Bacillus subtilis]|uniref:endonuclease YokF n=1 Tax=Bacillus subtilis TaxID=1423 RepID=UPI000C759F4A|nr:endonuclease YokF [Bacillus subtilis]MCO8148468.1 endonuclease YokF [Bacillus subtilis]MEC2179917.1 endonuclease YokF [Bacillus subtilis]PLV32520.1 SPBc2 prophage-derived endonuclease YokF precursor [Bacillus subtilis subsp. subtilis]QHM20378.1 SPBc2 prophage-derived endonuclease YokF [Bacillus subtilis]CAF1791132.1 SPBc2 prophage-derived endonuclease YokF [Bacillus subtilis]